MQLFPKLLTEMTNSVDPGQTAPEGTVWSGSALQYAISSETFDYEILGHLP